MKQGTIEAVSAYGIGFFHESGRKCVTLRGALGFWAVLETVYATAAGLELTYITRQLNVSTSNLLLPYYIIPKKFVTLQKY